VANHKPQNSPKSYLSYTVYKGTPPLTAYMKRHRGCACLMRLFNYSVNRKQWKEFATLCCSIYSSLVLVLVAVLIVAVVVVP